VHIDYDGKASRLAVAKAFAPIQCPSSAAWLVVATVAPERNKGWHRRKAASDL